MLGRLLACAVAMGMAQFALGAPAYAGEESQPAAAGERASYKADALPLLMLDERTSWGTPAAPARPEPGFTIGAGVTVSAAPPLRPDIASFDDLPAPAATLPTRAHGVMPVLTGGPTARVERIRLPSAARDAIGDSRADLPRPTSNRRSPLDTMLVFRIDGEPASPSFSLGGGVASVLNVLPRQ